mgnify:CR=1 FL=1
MKGEKRKNEFLMNKRQGTRGDRPVAPTLFLTW